ncbi:hypothetical protein ACTHS0_11115 [Neisseria sp. P0013.S009]
MRRCRLLDRRVSIVAGGFGKCRSGLRTLLAAYVKVVEYGLVFEV